MSVPLLIDFSQERIRVLHYTWIAFFITFFVWFNMAPLATSMLHTFGWLTPEHLKILAICNVALTIPARIIIGALIDKYGPRITYSLLMIVMAFPALVFAFADTFLQLLISRLILGSIGAGFVIGIRMVAQWFPPKLVGRAEGFYAGWGNFGSAGAAMILPFISLTILSTWLNMGTEGGIRWGLALSGIVCFLYGIAYFFLVRDLPGGQKFSGIKKTEPMHVGSYSDLIQYLAWSFPLVGTLALLAWRIGNVKVEGVPMISPNLLNLFYLICALIFVAHVIKTLQINLPRLRKGVPKEEQYHWGSIGALNTTYFANFGAELAVVSMLPMFFENVFSALKDTSGNNIMTATMAGLIASSFAFVNLFARPLGGLISDMFNSRKRIMAIYMLGIAVGFYAMYFIADYGPVDTNGNSTLKPMFEGMWWLVTATIITILCSVFVQGAEGATFAIIPMIHKPITGQIAGMAGAYGNVGAVVYLIIYSLVDAKTFFLIITAGAAVSFAYCLIFLKEPEGSFADEHETSAHHTLSKVKVET